mgnify:FL=1
MLNSGKNASENRRLRRRRAFDSSAATVFALAFFWLAAPDEARGQDLVVRGAVARAEAAPLEEGAHETAGPPVLVAVNGEIAEALYQVERWLKTGAEDRAVKVLQLLLARRDGFIHAEGGRYVGLSLRVNQLMAALDRKSVV